MSTHLALLIFVFGCFCGYQYRRVWKTHGPHWQLWVFGLCAAAALLAVGMIPITAAVS